MILVTGATGIVGRALVDALTATGEPVRAMTRKPATAGLPPHVEVVAGDRDDPRSLRGRRARRRPGALCGPEALGPADEVAILAEVLGRPLRYVEITPEAARRAMTDHGMSAELADAVVAKYATLEPSVSVPDGALRSLVSAPPRTFRDWVRAHASHFARALNRSWSGRMVP